VERGGEILGVAAAIGGERGDPLPAIGATHQVKIDRLGRDGVELAKAESEEGTVGRVRDGTGLHSIGLRVELEVQVMHSLRCITKPLTGLL
jgi:hypothetical protein